VPSDVADDQTKVALDNLMYVVLLNTVCNALTMALHSVGKQKNIDTDN
jgi:hypothetical protein